MIKSGLVLLVLLSLCAVAYSQSSQPQSSQPPAKDACLEKEISDFTRIISADGGRMKIGVLAEHITWFDQFQHVAADVIQTEFPTKFVFAGDDTMGVLVLYISGTSMVSSGAQYVSIRLQMLDSGELLLPENGNTFADLHLAKLGDPVRSMSGSLVFAEEGVLLPPTEQGMPFEVWQALRMQTIREKVHAVLAEFVANWDKAGKK